MSQSWTDDVYASGHVGQTDLQNMENNFAALKSLFSGAAQPASMAACHPWFDTTKHALKVRNDGDTAWIGLMHGDTSQKIWIYRNAAMSGWTIDSGVSDKVLGIKGGSTYTTGAATAGAWTQPNHTHTGPSHTHGVGTYDVPSHNHQWHDYASPTASSKTYDSGGNVIALTQTEITAQIHIDSITSGQAINIDGYTSNVDLAVTGISAAAGTGATGGGATANTYRPAAAVGTLQYLDL